MNKLNQIVLFAQFWKSQVFWSSFTFIALASWPVTFQLPVSRNDPRNPASQATCGSPCIILLIVKDLQSCITRACSHLWLFVHSYIHLKSLLTVKGRFAPASIPQQCSPLKPPVTLNISACPLPCTSTQLHFCFTILAFLFSTIQGLSKQNNSI